MLKKTISLIASAGMVGAMVMLAGPADAGTTWSDPQEITARFGREAEVSGTGRVAVWIRSNRLFGYGVSGPVRAAYYIRKTQQWSKSAAVRGSTETTRLMLSRNGDYALLESGTAGYSIAERKKAAKWRTAKRIVSGASLEAGQMSLDARTVVWVDWPETPGWQYPPGELKAITRDDTGEWSAPVSIGKVSHWVRGYPYEPSERASTAAVLSADGSTVVWLDENLALTSAAKGADGTWTPAGTVKDYAGVDSLGLSALQLSKKGSTVMWVRRGVDGILTSARTAGGWETPMMATVDMTTVEAMSPKGTSIAWVNPEGDVSVSTRLPSRWARAKTVGSVSYSARAQMAMVNKTLAYGSMGYKKGTSTCAVNTSLLVSGKWAKGKKTGRSVCYPSLAFNGRTMVWGNLKTKTLQSVKR